MRAPHRLVLLPALSMTACSALPAATRQGGDIGSLGVVFFWAALGVAAVVYGLILWSIVRYRKRDEELPPQFRANLPLEIAYTLIPVAIVVALFVLTFRVERAVESPSSDPAVTVRVQAFKWSWRFDYRDAGVAVVGSPEEPPEMVVPAGESVRLVLTATDVIHSFYVPDFLFKRDAIPGRTTTFDIAVEEPGVYRGQCAEFCGLDHYRMRFSVRAVPRAQFEAWLATAGGEAVP